MTVWVRCHIWISGPCDDSGVVLGEAVSLTVSYLLLDYFSRHGGLGLPQAGRLGKALDILASHAAGGCAASDTQLAPAISVCGHRPGILFAGATL